MKICRFNDNRIGVVRDEGVHDVSAILEKFEAVRYPFPLGDQLIERLDELRPERRVGTTAFCGSRCGHGLFRYTIR